MKNDILISSDAKQFSFTKKQFFKFLEKIDFGRIVIEDESETYIFGKDIVGLNAKVKVLNQKFYSMSIWNGSIGFAEAYMNNYWSVDDLTSLIRIMVLNIKVVDEIDSSWKGVLFRIINKFKFLLMKNSISGSKENISKHYDLGNSFFGLFLDNTMMYSAALFYNKNQNLETASIQKLKRICDKLELKENEHLLEIGTGWGGLAIYAAKNYGCNVTTATISKEQYDYAIEKVKQEKLSDKVNVILKDYRYLEGTYDKLVSVEMIEAVGPEFYDSYFKKCSNLVKSNGLFMLQAITIADQEYKKYCDNVDFINTYIFPGGRLPSLESILYNMKKYTNYNVMDIYDLTKDYAITLNKWKQRFLINKASIISQGFDQTFIRMWEYYFSYCEASFLERYALDYQILFAKSGFKKSL